MVVVSACQCVQYPILLPAASLSLVTSLQAHRNEQGRGPTCPGYEIPAPAAYGRDKPSRTPQGTTLSCYLSQGNSPFLDFGDTAPCFTEGRTQRNTRLSRGCQRDVADAGARARLGPDGPGAEVGDAFHTKDGGVAELSKKDPSLNSVWDSLLGVPADTKKGGASHELSSNGVWSLDDPRKATREIGEKRCRTRLTGPSNSSRRGRGLMFAEATLPVVTGESWTVRASMTQVKSSRLVLLFPRRPFLATRWGCAQNGPILAPGERHAANLVR